MTPQQIVAELDKYIVGQHNAKKAVAIALRNRYRRLQLPERLREEVTPKNIIMIGATGVGKTEIARRLARLTGSPFIKVEASKYTEVGYVGRDVESMIRDLAEIGVNLVRAEQREILTEKASIAATERILDILLPKQPYAEEGSDSDSREKFRTMLNDGKLEDRVIEINVDEPGPQVEILSNMNTQDMGFDLQDMMKNMFPGRSKKRKIKVSEARSIIESQELAKMIDMDAVKAQAIERVEQSGIIFIDEIDKVCNRAESGKGGGDISREGVQRDLLPIVEGSTVTTKYGMVKTDHILFVAAGAFSLAKPSDLIPELQGRFPIRVELDSLKHEDFVRILTEPESSLTKQYTALLESDGVDIEFNESGINAIAKTACEVNVTNENIGARRLHTIMEKLLEDISYNAPENVSGKIVIDEAYVSEHLGEISSNVDLSRYIL